MNAAVCTLFEGDYHYGLGALANSLYSKGFRGAIWAGYRGEIPFWAQPIRSDRNYQEFAVAPDCYIRFIPIAGTKFLSNCKPDFMLQLWQNYCPDAEALFYFDPDIVNKISWDFYEHWVKAGVALCEDGYPEMASNHPRKLGWLEFAARHGYTCCRQIEKYYNTGFIGVQKNYKYLLELWQELLELGAAKNCFNLSQSHVINREKSLYVYPFLCDDQDVFNLAIMLADAPLSTFGNEGMDLGKPGSIMSHAAGGFVVKPWRKQMIRKALGGVPPSLTDKLYYQHARSPIPLYSRSQYFWRFLALKCGAAIGRFIRRAPAWT